MSMSGISKLAPRTSTHFAYWDAYNSRADLLKNKTVMYKIRLLFNFMRKFEKIVIPYPGGNGTSTDPNESYRPWLENNVGKQGTDWKWEIGAPFEINLYICKKKKDMISLFMLTFYTV